jgi:hypothetical protein
MARNRHGQPPDLVQDPSGHQDWANSIHDSVYGINASGGTLNNANMADDLLTVLLLT